MRVPLFALASWFLTLGSGCQDDLHVCDITQRSCQEQIYYTTLDLRGDGYDPFGGLPPIRIISENDFRNELIAAATHPSSSSDKAWDVALALLHLYSPQTTVSDGGVADEDAGSNVDPQIDDEATHVYAYFDTKERSITIVSHPNEPEMSSRRLAMTSLAHEFVHALQDREVDLGRSYPTYDEYLAQKTIIEGDARFYELLFESKLASIPMSPTRIVQASQEELRYYLDNFDLLGSPFYAAQMLIYPFGSQYLAKAWVTGGNAAARRIFSRAPHTTLGFLMSPDGIPPRGALQPMTCQAPSPPGLTKVGMDRFGALVFFTFLQGWQIPQKLALTTAQGWRDDQILIFKQEGTQHVGVSWRIELDQPLSPIIYQKLADTGDMAVQMQGTALEITAQTTNEGITFGPDSACR